MENPPSALCALQSEGREFAEIIVGGRGSGWLNPQRIGKIRHGFSDRFSYQAAPGF
jgi:hypothetical protein